jgi:ADP-ribosylglycohydrolase
MGNLSSPVNDSKGCGGVMRVAPIGLLVEKKRVFETAARAAGITHGHPSGYLAAGAFATIIADVLNGATIEQSARGVMESLGGYPDHEEVQKGIKAALEAFYNRPASPETVESLGGGWIAEEALAIAIYCSLAAGSDFKTGIQLAVNHGGDSDSTGSLTGNLLGTLLGRESIPGNYLQHLELVPVIEEIANDLYRCSQGERYHD